MIVEILQKYPYHGNISSVRLLVMSMVLIDGQVLRFFDAYARSTETSVVPTDLSHLCKVVLEVVIHLLLTGLS